MKNILLAAALFSGVMALGQTEKFDLASFQRPKGWQRLDTNGVVMLYHSKTGNGVTAFCQIYLIPSRDAGTDAQQNFQEEWNNRIVKTTGSTATPQTSTDNQAGGWTAVTGRADINQNGIVYTCLLSAITGHGKEMSVIVNVAGPEYENEVQVFFDRLSMREPVVTGNVWNGNDKAPLNNTGGGQANYIYEVPVGWTPQKYSDGGVVITSPVYGTGERCTLSVLPMRAASADLQTAAVGIFTELFSRNYTAVTTYTSPSSIRGYSPQGWEYFIIKQGLKPRAGNYSDIFVFVFVARLGAQMAVITGISKDPLVSNCFGLNLKDIWPKFFYSLHFKNWNNTNDKETMQRLAGVWIAATATAGDRMAIAPNGRYAGASAAQHYYSNGAAMTTVTDAYFGDGAYAVHGNQITLTRDNDKSKHENGYFRVEQESMDGGRTWKTRLYLLRKSNIDGTDYELGYEKQ